MKLIFEKSVPGRHCDLLPKCDVETVALPESLRRDTAPALPEMSEVEKDNFIYVFFPFMFGIYPYTTVTDKQKAAMKEAKIDYDYQSVYDITYKCLIGLLGK